MLQFCAVITSICMYIHNWPVQRFSQEYDPASHTTSVVCVNFKHEWQELQFKHDSEQQIFEKTSHLLHLNNKN